VYLVDVFRNPRLPEQERLLWALLLFVGNSIAMTIYFVKFVWPSEEPPTGRTDDG